MQRSLKKRIKSLVQNISQICPKRYTIWIEGTVDLLFSICAFQKVVHCHTFLSLRGEEITSVVWDSGFKKKVRISWTTISCWSRLSFLRSQLYKRLMPHKAKSKQSMKSHSELWVLKPNFSLPPTGVDNCLFTFYYTLLYYYIILLYLIIFYFIFLLKTGGNLMRFIFLDRRSPEGQVKFSCWSPGLFGLSCELVTIFLVNMAVSVTSNSKTSCVCIWNTSCITIKKHLPRRENKKKMFLQ